MIHATISVLTILLVFQALALNVRFVRVNDAFLVCGIN
jgi:hypothetical protein